MVRLFVTLINLILLCSCSLNNANNVPIVSGANLMSNEKAIDFEVQYIRTDWSKSPEYPVITVIESGEELENYYDKYDGAYNYETETSISDAIDKYSDNYFKNGFIVIILLEEGSGSIRHTVEKIDENGRIYIKRLVPEVGTSDMAEWNIVIEITNEFLQDNFTVSISD